MRVLVVLTSTSVLFRFPTWSRELMWKARLALTRELCHELAHPPQAPGILRLVTRMRAQAGRNARIDMGRASFKVARKGGLGGSALETRIGTGTVASTGAAGRGPGGPCQGPPGLCNHIAVSYYD